MGEGEACKARLVDCFQTPLHGIRHHSTFGSAAKVRCVVRTAIGKGEEGVVCYYFHSLCLALTYTVRPDNGQATFHV